MGGGYQSTPHIRSYDHGICIYLRTHSTPRAAATYATARHTGTRERHRRFLQHSNTNVLPDCCVRSGPASAIPSAKHTRDHAMIHAA
eukprot:5398782-Pyramimonas_sp.AAC.1